MHVDMAQANKQTNLAFSDVALRGTVRYFLDSGRSGFQYNLDRVFVEACCELQHCSNAGQPHQQSPASDASAFEAVLHTDFEGLRLLAQRWCA